MSNRSAPTVQDACVAAACGAMRAIYREASRTSAKQPEYVLRAFQKKSQATPKKDIDTAKKRFVQVLGGAK